MLNNTIFQFNPVFIVFGNKMKKWKQDFVKRQMCFVVWLHSLLVLVPEDQSFLLKVDFIYIVWFLNFKLTQWLQLKNIS